MLISQVSMKPWPAITSNALANTRFGQLNAALATFSSNIISEKTPKLHTWRTDFATKCMSCYGFAAGRPGAASRRYWYRVVGSWWFSFSMDHVSQGVGVKDNLWKHHLFNRNQNHSRIYTLIKLKQLPEEIFLDTKTLVNWYWFGPKNPVDPSPIE